jgi:hypothetical protein
MNNWLESHGHRLATLEKTTSSASVVHADVIGSGAIRDLTVLRGVDDHELSLHVRGRTRSGGPGLNRGGTSTGSSGPVLNGSGTSTRSRGHGLNGGGMSAKYGGHNLNGFSSSFSGSKAHGDGVDARGGCFGVRGSGGFGTRGGRGGHGIREAEGHGNQGDLGGGRFGRDQANDIGPYRPKINFLKYDGESDPLPWLNKCTTYLCGMGTPPDERVWMASLHFDGIAVEWYYALERDVGMFHGNRF